MAIQRHTKLNQLQRVLPEGLLVDSSWLQKRGYSRQLIAQYVSHGWLSSPVRSVYRRGSSHIDPKSWEAVVISLQRLLEIPVIVGGRTALELLGLSHYVSMTDVSNIHLYGSEPPPSWINKLKLKQQFLFHSTLLFAKKNASIKKNQEFQQAYFTEYHWGTSKQTILISTPERAILEVFDELPTHETFHQADVLMEGLTNLRPKYLNTLLSDCRSVKTKRLFLWFAQRHNHAWLKAIDIAKVDIGKGKRMIVAGGKLDPTYLITVPEEFANDTERTI